MVCVARGAVQQKRGRLARQRLEAQRRDGQGVGGPVDTLLKPFARCEFIKLSREELDERIATGEGVMLSA